jgi:hypothetical protein
VLNNDTIGADDALEILKWLVGLDSVIEIGNDSFEAARINRRTNPTADDALEILKYVVGMPNLISQRKMTFGEPVTFTVHICETSRWLRYVNDSELTAGYKYGIDVRDVWAADVWLELSDDFAATKNRIVRNSAGTELIIFETWEAGQVTFRSIFRGDLNRLVERSTSISGTEPCVLDCCAGESE